MEINHFSNQEQKFCLDFPLEVYKCEEEDYLEVNTITVTKTKDLGTEPIIQTDHLNEEETNELKKLYSKFPNIFYREGKTLIFTYLIKHQIKTTDQIPIHIKLFRYSIKENK